MSLELQNMIFNNVLLGWLTCKLIIQAYSSRYLAWKGRFKNRAITNIYDSYR